MIALRAKISSLKGRSPASLVITLSVLLCAPGAIAEEKVSSEDLVLIVSDAVPLRDITFAMLRGIFTQRKVTLEDGTTLIPINLAPHSVERTMFDGAVLEMDPEQVGRYWIDQKIRGLALPPRVISSIPLAAKMAEKVKGAITYVPLSAVPAGTHALTIDGRRAGEPGYLLNRRAP